MTEGAAGMSVELAATIGGVVALSAAAALVVFVLWWKTPPSLLEPRAAWALVALALGAQSVRVLGHFLSGAGFQVVRRAAGIASAGMMMAGLLLILREMVTSQEAPS